MAVMIALVPAFILFSGSLVLFVRGRTVYAVLQLVGTAGLVTVVLTHLAETFHLFPGMGWGLDNSAGHYLDLGSAIVGFTLFPVGYLLHTITLKPH